MGFIIQVWTVGNRRKLPWQIAPDADMPACGVDQRVDLDRLAVLLQLHTKLPARDIERLAHYLSSGRVPVNPNRAAWPRAWPALFVRGSNFLCIFPEGRNLFLQIDHVRLSCALRLFTGGF